MKKFSVNTKDFRTLATSAPTSSSAGPACVWRFSVRAASLLTGEAVRISEPATFAVLHPFRDCARGLFSLGLPEYIQFFDASARPPLNFRCATVTHGLGHCVPEFERGHHLDLKLYNLEGLP